MRSNGVILPDEMSRRDPTAEEAVSSISRRAERGDTPLLPRWALSNTLAAAALIASVAFAFFSNWFFLSPAVEHVQRSVLTALVVGNVAIAVGFAFLIGARIWHVWSDRRNQLSGSRTHLRLAAQFAAVAVTPAVIAFLFAFTILRTSINDVFSERIDTYVQTARDFANAYFQDETNDAAINLSQIEMDLRTDALLGLTPTTSPLAFRQRLAEQAFGRNLAAIMVFAGDRRLIARVEMTPGLYGLPAASVFDRMDAAFERDSSRGDRGHFDLNNEESIDMFRAFLKIDAFDGGYIAIYKLVPSDMQSRLSAVRGIRDDWNEAKRARARVEQIFLLGYVVLAMIILFGAVWLALWAATRLVQPIGRLIRMAERVSGGELGARVEVYRDDGELGVLARALNHMTAQLQTQRDDLVETNRQFDRRRRFTEAVLSGVSAGVIGVSADGRLTIANRSAADFFDIDTENYADRTLEEISPELQKLFVEASCAPSGEYASQIEVDRNGRIRTLNVRIGSDAVAGEPGYVITFDDITELIGAQRSAAWGDVARRIAHEIKNPLTPIQLSAERLRRKYLAEIKTSPEIFDKCTETIIRHVGDIGRMVDEFSSFARMPKPVMAREDIRELVRAAVFPQRVAFSDIEFITDLPDDAVISKCDGRLIVQALGNLIKNAGESVAARKSHAEIAKGRIVVRLEADALNAQIHIIDNGVGLPVAERHRLTEPYMTTRAKGTGLGLAIVKKVAEDHGGELLFRDCSEFGSAGARVSLILPVEETATASTAVVEHAAAE